MRTTVTDGWNRPRCGPVVSVAIAVGLVGVLGGCVLSKDPGPTPEAQLCDVLGVALDGEAGSFRLLPLLEAPAGATSDVELAPIAIGYRTWAEDYDDLGPYEAAVRFAADRVAASDGASPLGAPGPDVLASARAVDESIADGACAD